MLWSARNADCTQNRQTRCALRELTGAIQQLDLCRLSFSLCAHLRSSPPRRNEAQRPPPDLELHFLRLVGCPISHPCCRLDVSRFYGSAWGRREASLLDRS